MTGNDVLPASPSATASVTAIKRAVSSLTPAELDEIYKHITILRQLSKGKSSATSNTDFTTATTVEWQERIFYDAVATGVAKQLGSAKAMPLGAFRKTPMYSQWSRALTKALAQHQIWFPQASRPQTISMLRLYADIILGSLNVPEHLHGFGWRSVCWGLENLGVVVDKSFPDYARNGLLPLVATLRTAPA